MKGSSGWRCGASLFILSLIMLFGAFATPQPAAAQCAGWCSGGCGVDEAGWFGWGDGNSHTTNCVYGNWCGDCVSTNASEVGESESQILTEIRNASPQDLPNVLATYSDRLLLHEARNLLAIRGDACQAAEVTAVVFVRPALTQALSRLGVNRLTEGSDQ